MPIVGITDKKTEDYPTGLSIIGKVWKGGEKTDRMPGRDLGDKFRVEIEDERWRKKFLDAYGTLTPQSINIYLPFQTVDRCFETWFAAFTAQGFKHKCDGETIVEKMVGMPYEGRDGTKVRYSKQKVNEPCLKGDNPVCNTCGEKGSGLLYFYVRELYSAGMGATKGFRMSIHGANDIPILHEQLSQLQQAYGSLSGSPVPHPATFGYIPFILTRTKRNITKPIVETKTENGKKRYNHTGARSQSEYWALSVSEDPAWLESLQRFYQEQEYMRLSAHPELLRLYNREVISLPPSAQIALPSASTTVEATIVDVPQSESLATRSQPSKPASVRPATRMSAPSDPVETESPKKPPNENGQKIMSVIALLELDPVEAYSSATFALEIDKESTALTPQECTKVIDQILVNWGFKQGCFNAIVHARNAFVKLMESPNVEPTLPAIVAAWQKECDRRTAAIAESKTLNAIEPPDGWKDAVPVG